MSTSLPTIPTELTPAEREVIDLMRANSVTDAELVTVPRVFITLLNVALTASKAARGKAQNAIDQLEYLSSQCVTPE